MLLLPWLGGFGFLGCWALTLWEKGNYPLGIAQCRVQFPVAKGSQGQGMGEEGSFYIILGGQKQGLCWGCWCKPPMLAAG